MKKTILKIFAVVCALCLMLAITGCSAKQTQVDSTTASTNSETTQTIETTVPDENTATQNIEETVATEEETKPVVEEQKTDKEETKPVVNEQKPNKEEEKPNNNTAEQEQAEKEAALTNAKALAKNALDTYVTASSYREAQKTALATAIANGKTAVDAAADSAAVDAAVAAAKPAIDAIPTNAELTAAENAAAAQALAAAKTNAKAALDAYVDADDYREAQQTELATAIANGKTAIDAAADSAAIDAAVAAAKTAIDAIPTDAELTAEENAAAAQALAAAKTNAKAALDAYVDADDYHEAQQTELAAAIANGKAAIDVATDTAGVDSALAAAKAVIDAIETDAEITAKSPTITTTITDGMTFTNNKATLDVWAKDASGNKLAASKVTVTVNGEVASINWDDTEKTSYNFVFEDGENTVIITATDGGYCTTVTYTVLCDASAPTTITVAMEGFTVGLDYIVAPYKLILDEDTLTDMAGLYGYADAAEMKENLTAALALDYTLQLHGLTMGYQGGLESGSGFYMSSVSGLDTSNAVVPDALLAKLEENGYYPDSAPYTEGTLEEFDFTFGSGWMYFVNNVAPNVGFCDYVPQDGDVMRIQFTLAYGADIGSTMVGDLWFESVDRDELTQLIADAIEAGVDYSEALEVVSTVGVTQDDLDEASRKLREELSE